MKTSNQIKYQSGNPIQQFLIKRFYSKVIRLLENKKINNVVDIGCGEGYGLNYLIQNNIGNRHTGLDSSDLALKSARKMHSKCKYLKGSIYNTPFKDNKFDLVVCSEVLEHLAHPKLAIKELNRIGNKYVLITVPFEPWFRIMNFVRGKYLSNLGNHPEHINWWGTGGLRKIISPHLKIVSHVVSLPWQIALCTVVNNEA